MYVNQYFEKNLTTSEVTTHYYLGGKEIAFKKGSTLEYLHTDHLGSTSVTTNTSGAQVSKVAYFPFGGARSQTGVLDTDKRFTGQRLDQTGLYYYGARYYDATIGRFISPDTIVPNPANPQSLNRYSYCLNNPLKYVDPSGHGEAPPAPPSISISNPIGMVMWATWMVSFAQWAVAQAPAPPVSKATPTVPSGVTAVTIVPPTSSGVPAMANTTEAAVTTALVLAGVCYLAYETSEACKNVAGNAGGTIGIPKDVTDKIVEGVEIGISPLWYGLEKLGGYLFAKDSPSDDLNVDQTDNLTDSPGKIAEETGFSTKEVKKAIEKVKQGGMPRTGEERNPDVWVDPSTGEVYPKTPDGGVGDSIGNIFDHLCP